jgi:hypothetical protein
VLVELPCAVVFHGPEEASSRLLCSGLRRVCSFQILPDESQRHRANGNRPDLAALAVDAEVGDAFNGFAGPSD